MDVWTENMPQIYKELNVVCLPTYYGKGLPKALIEAAASGLASIATDTPGYREVVGHAVNGLLIPPRDVPALVTSILSLIDKPRVREEMGRAGRRMAEAEFSSGQVNKKTIAVYQDIAQQWIPS